MIAPLLHTIVQSEFNGEHPDIATSTRQMSLIQKSTVQQHIEAGQGLRDAAAAIVAPWQTDDDGNLPSFIAGESHPLGELEFDIRRWFNSVELLTRDLLTHGSDTTELRGAVSRIRELLRTTH